MKKACRKASHCDWNEKGGRCIEEDEISVISLQYNDLKLQDEDLVAHMEKKCEKKDKNGCVSDYFCKWTRKKKIFLQVDQKEDDGGDCSRHNCRHKNKDRCNTFCQWNSQHTRCDTHLNSWSGDANWHWENGTFVEIDDSVDITVKRSRSLRAD